MLSQHIHDPFLSGTTTPTDRCFLQRGSSSLLSKASGCVFHSGCQLSVLQAGSPVFFHDSCFLSSQSYRSFLCTLSFILSRSGYSEFDLVHPLEMRRYFLGLFLIMKDPHRLLCENLNDSGLDSTLMRPVCDDFCVYLMSAQDSGYCEIYDVRCGHIFNLFSRFSSAHQYYLSQNAS